MSKLTDSINYLRDAEIRIREELKNQHDLYVATEVNTGQEFIDKMDIFYEAVVVKERGDILRPVNDRVILETFMPIRLNAVVFQALHKDRFHTELIRKNEDMLPTLTGKVREFLRTYRLKLYLPSPIIRKPEGGINDT